MTRGRFDLGDRVEPVFERMLGEQRDVVDSRELAEAEAFWDWLGTFERPVETEPALSNWRPLHARVGAFAAAIAAAWLLMIGAGLHMPWAGSDAASGTRYAAGRGERRVIDMRDGSVITLAAESAIDVRYTSANRLVRLERGEALFKVAHNKQRPFIVEAAGGQVTAVGTAFDVKLASPSKAQVTVVEGVIGIAVRSANPNTQEQITRLARKGEEVSFGVDPEQQARSLLSVQARRRISAWPRRGRVECSIFTASRWSMSFAPRTATPPIRLRCRPERMGRCPYTGSSRRETPPRSGTSLRIPMGVRDNADDSSHKA